MILVGIQLQDNSLMLLEAETRSARVTLEVLKVRGLSGLVAQFCFLCFAVCVFLLALASRSLSRWRH